MSGRVFFEGAEGNRLVADRMAAEGAPVVLLHGGGQTRHAWSGAGHRFQASGFDVYSIDQRGHGDSDWVPSGNYGFDDFGRDLVAVSRDLSQQTNKRPFVVGASLGGIAALIAAGHLAPDDFAGIVLVDITPSVDPNGVAKIIGFMADKLDDGFGSVEEAADAIAAYMPHRKRPDNLAGLSKNLRLHDDGRYRWHWDPKFIGGKDLNDGVKKPIPEGHLEAAATKLRTPVQLVRGRQSELVSDDHVREFLDLVPHAKYADISGAGHMVAGDRNDVFAEAVLDFLQDQISGANTGNARVSA